MKVDTESLKVELLVICRNKNLAWVRCSWETILISHSSFSLFSGSLSAATFSTFSRQQRSTEMTLRREKWVFRRYVIFYLVVVPFAGRLAMASVAHAVVKGGQYCVCSSIDPPCADTLLVARAACWKLPQRCSLSQLAGRKDPAGWVWGSGSAGQPCSHLLLPRCLSSLRQSPTWPFCSLLIWLSALLSSLPLLTDLLMMLPPCFCRSHEDTLLSLPCSPRVMGRRTTRRAGSPAQKCLGVVVDGQ